MPEPQSPPPTQSNQVIVNTQPSNGLGVAGFICGILGFFTCGILALVGLLLSFIALFKRPRGFAIAGLIISLLAIAIPVLIILAMGAVVMVPLLAMLGFVAFENQFIAMAASQDVHEHYQLHQVLPDQSEGDSIMLSYTNSDGDTPRYSITGATTFELSFPGDDGLWGTSDDYIADYDVTTMSPWGGSGSSSMTLPAQPAPSPSASPPASPPATP